MKFKIKIKRNKNGLYILDRPQEDKGPRASNPGKGPEGGNTNKPHSPGGNPGYNPGGKQQHLGNSPNPLGGGGYGHGGVGGFGEGGGGGHGGYGGGHGGYGRGEPSGEATFKGTIKNYQTIKGPREYLEVIFTFQGVDYPAVSGPWGKGSLPGGDYIAKYFMPRTETSYKDPDGLGWSVYLEPNFGTGRNQLLIHPDGGPWFGTLGCIGIQGNTNGLYKAFQEYFKSNNSFKVKVIDATPIF